MWEAVLLIYALLFARVGDIETMSGAGARHITEATLKSVEDNKETMLISTEGEPMKDPKMSPKDQEAYDFVTIGSVILNSSGQAEPRFRVFNRSLETAKGDGMPTARMLLRMWDYSYRRLRIDHSRNFMRQVDLYMTQTGKAGGEQLFDNDPFTTDEFGHPMKVNTIYIYNLSTFTDKLERAREIAHEYGHALLPAFGVYQGPEDWANGDIGERLYLKWLSEDFAADKLNGNDTMGATLAQLQSYVKANVEPHAKNGFLNGLDQKKLVDRSQTGYNELLNATCYIQYVFPKNKVGRALMLANGDQKGTMVIKGILGTAEEIEKLDIAVPPFVQGKPIWVPLNKGTLTGGKILEKKGGFAKVQPTGKVISIKNPKVKD